MSNFKSKQVAAAAQSSDTGAKKDEGKKNEKDKLGNLSQNYIFVGNLTVESTGDQLKKLFCQFGNVLEVFINSDLGFASVKMDTREKAEAAIHKLNGMELNGKKILLRFASEGKSLKVDTFSTAVKVENLSPVVTNELLKQAFSQFGPVERAVVITDDKGESTTRGIVEFKRVLSAQSAVQKIEEGCFLITSSPRPISATMMEQEDSNSGLSEENMKKTTEYYEENLAPPRFPAMGSFEEQCARTWKIRYQLERQQREQFEENIRASRRIFEEQMITCWQKQQEALKIKQEVLSHSDEEESIFKKERKRESEARIRMEAQDVEINQRETPAKTVTINLQKDDRVVPQAEESTILRVRSQKATHPVPKSADSQVNNEEANEVALVNNNETNEIEEMISNESDGERRKKLIKDKYFPYKCPQCPKCYKTPSSYRDHVLDHSEERPYKCTLCEKGFRQLNKLQHHVTTCTAKSLKRKMNKEPRIPSKVARKREKRVPELPAITGEDSDDSECGDVAESSCRKCAKLYQNGVEAMKSYFCGDDGEESAKKFLKSHSLIPRYRCCSKCKQVCRYETKRKRYKCDKSDEKGVRCNFTMSECKGTFFAHLQMTYKEFMTFLFRYFSPNISLNSESDIKRTSGTFTKWMLRFNEVSRNFVENQTPIGGPETTVQIEEIFVCNRKDGDSNRDFWILEGTEEGSGRKFLYYFEGQPRHSDSMISIIQRFVLPGGAVTTDKHQAYNQLAGLGYEHAKTLLGTQTAYRLWGDIKHHVNMRGQTANYMALYICRYILIKSFDSEESRVHQFLKSAADLYPIS